MMEREGAAKNSACAKGSAKGSACDWRAAQSSACPQSQQRRQWDESALRRAAVRLVQKQANIDLSPCQHWLRFCDIHYQRPSKVSSRPDGHDVVTVFCVLVHDLPLQQQPVEVKEVSSRRAPLISWLQRDDRGLHTALALIASNGRNVGTGFCLLV
eukprot:969251-Pelagomonas_calceolata.AAC.4